MDHAPRRFHAPRIDYARPTAFALGLGISALPAFGPFAAALFVFTRRWPFLRSDMAWLLAGLTFSVGDLLRGDLMGALSAVATIAGPWVVYRTFAELQRTDETYRLSRAMALGLLVGYTTMVALGLATSLATVHPDGAPTLLSALTWQSSPAVFGHVTLMFGAWIILFTRHHPPIALVALALAALGVLVSGSLEAAIGWIIVAAAFVALREHRPGWTRLLELTALLTISITAILLAPLLGWGSLGFLLDTNPPANVTTLPLGTDDPRGDAWEHLQRRIPDAAGKTSTLSSWTHTTSTTTSNGTPGFQDYARPTHLPAATTPDAKTATPNDVTPFTLTRPWRDDDATASIAGPGPRRDASLLDQEPGWTHLPTTLQRDPSSTIPDGHVNFTPQASREPAGTTRVAGLTPQASNRAGPYVPESTTSSLTFGYARAPLWSTAWRGFLERPWTGWGRGAFADLYASDRQAVERHERMPAHPHNMLLTILFERGVFGLAGLVLLLAVMLGGAFRRRDAPFLAVLAALAVVNTFDATLLLGAVLYPLAAAAGWRASAIGTPTSSDAHGRQLGARLTLAATDAAAALAGLGLALAVARGSDATFTLTTLLLSMTIAWPALSWREGLYPGYALTPAQELQKQVSAWLLAAILVTLAAWLFPTSIDVPPLARTVWLTSSLLLATTGRAAVKRLLHTAGAWGRPVILLGAGRTGQRIARSLQRARLDGLEPVAFFDDDPALQHATVAGLPVRGTLDEATTFARREGIDHAIVAIPNLAWPRLDELLSGHGDVLRRVQYIPRLGNLPSADVKAVDLDGLLALEVRNGLYTPLNRWAKRSSDLLLGILATLMSLPLLLVLWILVRLDSPGPALHRSPRIGEGGTTFDCIKFRTMYEDAEERLETLLDGDPALRAEYERWHKLENDPRITRLGRILRRTSIDELPQLLNVLRGEMSLVGPRPYLQREREDMGRFATIIFQAKPGITGHWQVTARNSVTFDDRLEMEAHYVRNWSIWWDVILLVHTPWVVVAGKGEAK